MRITQLRKLPFESSSAKKKYKNMKYSKSDEAVVRRRNIHCRLIDDISLKGIIMSTGGQNDSCYGKELENYMNQMQAAAASSSPPPLSQVRVFIAGAILRRVRTLTQMPQYIFLPFILFIYLYRCCPRQRQLQCRKWTQWILLHRMTPARIWTPFTFMR